MADLPAPLLSFAGTCPDCGERRVELPPPLPPVGDDFDWRVRDYDGFRLAMLEELAARFPERTRWTPADLEVVLVEVLAAVLDQLSDMLDRVTAEAWLETARRPESVLRLLSLIGYPAVLAAAERGEIALGADEDPAAPEARRRLAAHWRAEPHAMEAARRAGPWSLHAQHRMVTVDDHARRLEEHPLVLRAHAASGWGGSWNVVRVAVIAVDGLPLDAEAPAARRPEVERFHRLRELPPPAPPPASVRTVLAPYLESTRLVAQEVVLIDAVAVPITFSLSVRVAPSFFRSEVRRAVRARLGTGRDGFFRPGRLRFGEDLHAGDLLAAVTRLDGVESACLNRFKRLGGDHPDQTASGRLAFDGLEVAVCDDDAARPERGYWRLTVHGGIAG